VVTLTTLYVHVADDGGILAIDGDDGRSSWVTEEELARRVDGLVAAGGSVLLSQERGSALATPIVVANEGAGAPVVAATEVHPDAVRRGGSTALMAAAYVGAVALVEDLLRRGADVDARDESGYTALMYAANGAQEEVVPLLLAAGADPSATDHDGTAPLMFAAQHGSLRTVKRLLAAGADAAARRRVDGITAADAAAANGHERVAGILRAAAGGGGRA
jgi:hypothetical protein